MASSRPSNGKLQTVMKVGLFIGLLWVVPELLVNVRQVFVEFGRSLVERIFSDGKPGALTGADYLVGLLTIAIAIVLATYLSRSVSAYFARKREAQNTA